MTVEEQMLIKALSNECDRLHGALKRIQEGIQREADYYDEVIDSDIAKGLYLAGEIIDQCVNDMRS